MGTAKQFSLKWNNYSQHIVSAFEDLRGDDDLTDVTLSCDGKRIKAHKILLSACSVFFKETFRENPCKHPVVILKGVSFADLQAAVTFMYNGQVNVSQERLNSFLQTAELLQIKGLTEMNDQEELSTKKRPQSVSSSGDPVITNVTHGKASSLEDSSVITPELVTARPPTPKRKRIGPASFMQQQQQQLLSQQKDPQIPSSNNSSSSNLGASTSTKSTAGSSGVSSSTGGLLNPETVTLPSMDSDTNSQEPFSHGIIKFEEEEVPNEDGDYETNNLSEDNSSMQDILGNVEQEQSSLASYVAGSSGQQSIQILSGGQDAAVRVVQSGQIMATDGGDAEAILPYEISRFPVYTTASTTFNNGLSTSLQALASPSPAKNRVLLLRRKTTTADFQGFSTPISVVPVLTSVTPTNVGIFRSSGSSKRKAPTVPRIIDTSEPLTPPPPEETWHQCSMCDKKYKCRSSLDSHVKIHQGEIATCEYCGQTMSRTRDLKRHIATVHRTLLQAQEYQQEQEGPTVELLCVTPDMPDPLETN